MKGTGKAYRDGSKAVVENAAGSVKSFV